MARAWMGWKDLGKALADESLAATGSVSYIRMMRQWLGLRKLASISKRGENARAGIPVR